MKKHYRQGDVLITFIGEDVDTSKMKKIEPDSRGRHVLAEGEATGHAHAIFATECSSLFETESGEMVFRTSKPTTVVHDEHAPIDLGKGCFSITRQREYVRGDVRLVAD